MCIRDSGDGGGAIGHRLLHHRHHILRHRLRGQRCGPRLKQPAQFEEVQDFGRGQPRQHEAARGRHQIAFSRQPHQRIARRHPRDAKLGRHGDIDIAVIPAEDARADALDQSVIDAVAQILSGHRKFEYSFCRPWKQSLH